MKRFLLIVVGLALVCAVIYLVATNGTVTDFQLTPNLKVSYSLGALMVASFLTGAVTVLVLVMIQAGGRALLSWRENRRERSKQQAVQMEAKGEQLMWQGDARQGRALLEKAYRREPSNAYAVLALAASYHATGEIDRERQFLTDAASEHHHTNPDILIALSQAHAFAGEKQQALEVLERLRALHPRAPRVLSALRDAYLEAGRWQDAVSPQEALIAELRDANQISEENATLATIRYQASLAIEDQAERAAALEAQVERRSVSVPVAVSLGDTFLELGRKADAISIWDRALKATPQSVLIERMTGIAEDETSRGKIATALRKLRVDTTNPTAVKIALADLLLADDQVDDAANELSSIEDRGAGGRQLHRVEGEIQRRRGEFEKAVESLAHADTERWHYSCTKCGRASAHWAGVCPCCKSFDSMRSALEIATE